VFLSLSARAAGTLAALTLVACSAAAPAAPEAPAPTPAIVVTYQSPAVGVASPSPRASAEPAPSAAPSVAPTPTRLESTNFFFLVPVGWTITAQSATPEGLTLRGADARAAFSVTTLGGEPNLAERRAEAVEEAGSGILTHTNATLDEVSGYYITSNRDTPDGKRYVVEYGFVYRHKTFVLQARWDKRQADADAVARDVQAIVKSFRWL
jgi:hypothetical protein